MVDPAQPQMLSAWIRRSIEEIGAFATEEVLAVFQDAVGEDSAWQSAKQDPSELLRSKGITVPETLQVVFADEAASGDNPGRRCLSVNRHEPPPDPGAPPIIWRYEICLLWQ